MLPEDEKESKIKEIRSIVSELEKDLAANYIDPTDKEFWNKVKLLRPDNHEFWEKIVLRVGNEPTFLEPKTDPYDLIKLIAINAGGFSLVAKSYDAVELDYEICYSYHITEDRCTKTNAGVSYQLSE